MQEVTHTLGRLTPLQSTIDLWKTTTPNKFHIQMNAHIPTPDVPPVDTIENTLQRHPDIPRADIPHPPLIDPSPQIPTTLIQYYLQKNADTMTYPGQTFICDCGSTTKAEQEQEQHYKVMTILM